MPGLVSALKTRGVVDIIFDSFDATWTPSASGAGRLGSPRREYLVDIVESPEAMKATFGQTHRRHVQRGERSGWEFATVEGSEAGRIMDQVQGSAAERAARREDRFDPGGSADLLPYLSTAPLDTQGVRVFVARNADAVLSAALVGWNGGRAFYVLGGSTPEGYQASASVWLHWKVMQTLWAVGVRVYNFGGTPADAGDPGHPAHGLHRFKMGFSPREEVRLGIAYELGTFHHVGHRVLGRLMRRDAR
jgi:CelD/BcsL family acetyltransferase involved in cellulose biosynthesis